MYAAERRRVRDSHRVEQAVLTRRVWRDLKCAAKPPAVGDDKQQPFCRGSVFASGELDAAIAEELPQSGVRINQRPFEPSSIRRTLEHRDVETKADTVEEMPVLDSSNVNAAIGPVDGESRRRVIIARRYGDGLREIVAGTGGNEGEPAVRAAMHHRIGNIAPCSVTADGDDRRRTVVEGASSEERFVTRARRALKRGFADADVRERASDGGLDARATSAPRGWIQNDANTLGNAGSGARFD